VVGNCPGQKKNGLDIEDDEDEGVDVILYPELHPRLTDSLEAALVGGRFHGVWLFGTDDKG
jgi:hypothetical protein